MGGKWKKDASSHDRMRLLKVIVLLAPPHVTAHTNIHISSPTPTVYRHEFRVHSFPQGLHRNSLQVTLVAFVNK